MLIWLLVIFWIYPGWNLVRLLYVGGQEGSQLQQLTGAVPRVKVQVEVRQPAEVRKGFGRSRTQTVPGQIQSLEAHQPPEADTIRHDYTVNLTVVIWGLCFLF